MTLTELRYIVAVAQEKHFGRAAQKSLITQPTLSVSVKKLEDELSISIFERTGSEVNVTPIGQRVVAQAQKILAEVNALKEIAKTGQDPLSSVVRLGIIYTVGPYILPHLMKYLSAHIPQLPLILQENFTHNLIPQVRHGDIDVAIVALPCDTQGLNVQPIYEEPFNLAVPTDHPWANAAAIDPKDIHGQTMLLLGSGHCLRDQVLEICPEQQSDPNLEGWQKTFEGSSLETIRHMVAAGLGMTVLPHMATHTALISQENIRYLPFSAPSPSRTIVLLWRKSFDRPEVIDALAHAMTACDFSGVTYLTSTTR